MDKDIENHKEQQIEIEAKTENTVEIQEPAKVQEPVKATPDKFGADAMFLERIFGGDKVLWIIISCLVFMSVLVVYSSTASLAYRTLDGDTSHFLFDQIRNLTLGMISMTVFYLIPYRYYGRFAEFIFILAILISIHTAFFGQVINGASRWTVIPIIKLSFQPSDFLRVALVLLLCKKMNRIGDNFENVYLLPKLNYDPTAPSNRYIIQKYTLPLLVPIALSCFIILIANLSTAGLTFLTCCALFYVARVKTKEVFKLILWTFVSVVLLVSIMAVFDLGRSRTWVNRCTNYIGLNVDRDKDISSDDDYQEHQAQITVASGGLLWGKGPGQSTQRSNLPHSYSDFAYAFIIEEYGDLMALFVLLFYLWLFARSRLIAKKINSQFPSMLVLGLSFMITFQALINMMVSVGLIPITGQTLPLISKGGSSVIFTGMALGMILSVSRDAEKKALEPKVDEKTQVVVRNQQVKIKKQ